MIYAPETPNATQLHAQYPLTRGEELRIAGVRHNLHGAMMHPDNTITVAGPCALTNEPERLAAEQTAWSEFAIAEGGLIAVRRNPFKPRSVKSWAEKVEKWHGLETGCPAGVRSPGESAEDTFQIIHAGAQQYGNIAMEMAFPEHVYRYGPLASFAWVGARTATDYYGDRSEYTNFLELLARREPTLPVAIKNDTSGSLDRALDDVAMINGIRSGLGIACVARAVLFYRGGEDAQTADAWQAKAEEAISRTGGAVLLDMAHDAERACDPNGKFEKSDKGQLICWDRAVELRRSGRRWVGQATESSDLVSPMDPPASIEEVMGKLREMNLARAA